MWRALSQPRNCRLPYPRQGHNLDSPTHRHSKGHKGLCIPPSSTSARSKFALHFPIPPHPSGWIPSCTGLSLYSGTDSVPLPRQVQPLPTAKPWHHKTPSSRKPKAWPSSLIPFYPLFSTRATPPMPCPVSSILTSSLYLSRAL